jgi:predicted nucleic acid-binding protein
MQAAWHNVEADVTSGVLMATDSSWDRVLVEGELIGAQHTSTVGCRTLDILHVAAARFVGATEFCTFDARQSELAKKVGLSVVIP